MDKEQELTKEKVKEKAVEDGRQITEKALEEYPKVKEAVGNEVKLKYERVVANQADMYDAMREAFVEVGRAAESKAIMALNAAEKLYQGLKIEFTELTNVLYKGVIADPKKSLISNANNGVIEFNGTNISLLNLFLIIAAIRTQSLFLVEGDQTKTRKGDEIKATHFFYNDGAKSTFEGETAFDMITSKDSYSCRVESLKIVMIETPTGQVFVMNYPNVDLLNRLNTYCSTCLIERTSESNSNLKITPNEDVTMVFMHQKEYGLSGGISYKALLNLIGIVISTSFSGLVGGFVTLFSSQIQEFISGDGISPILVVKE